MDNYLDFEDIGRVYMIENIRRYDPPIIINDNRQTNKNFSGVLKSKRQARKNKNRKK